MQCIEKAPLFPQPVGPPVLGIIRWLADCLSHVRGEEEGKQQSESQQGRCASASLHLLSEATGPPKSVGACPQFNEACKSHAPNQGACLWARLCGEPPPHHSPPPPPSLSKSDLIAEYISHPGENERFSVTGWPRSSQEPWAGINLHNPARSFAKEQMDPQLFALRFMCGLDCVVQGAALVTSREPVCFRCSSSSQESLPVGFFGGSFLGFFLCAQAQSEDFLAEKKKDERCSCNV